MKFKIGDKVKFIKRTHSHSSDVKLGRVYTIEYIDYMLDKIPYLTKENKEWFKEDELELVKTAQFTKSDLKDGDIVTYRNGAKRTLKGEKLINQEGYEMYDLIQYKTDLTDIGEQRSLDIIKVERPVQYETVYERKEEILDEAEKRYLRAVIRPFRDRVEYIEKEWCFGNREYIIIAIKDSEELIFPAFKENTKYKNMELGKEYTLEELRNIKE